MTTKQLAEAAAKSEDLGNLLDHIAWTDAVKPILMKRREAFSGLLVQSVLAGSDLKNSQPYTKEQLAGAIYGIDQIITIMEKILKDGERALAELRQQNLTLSATSQ